jgi:hypothetical protein
MKIRYILLLLLAFYSHYALAKLLNSLLTFDCGVGDGFAESTCVNKRINQLLVQQAFLFSEASVWGVILSVALKERKYLRIWVMLGYLLITTFVSFQMYRAKFPS